MSETNSWIALLRAINVGGTGKLPMADLRAICERIGVSNPTPKGVPIAAAG